MSYAEKIMGFSWVPPQKGKLESNQKVVAEMTTRKQYFLDTAG